MKLSKLRDDFRRISGIKPKAGELYEAVLKGNMTAANSLLERGADANDKEDVWKDYKKVTKGMDDPEKNDFHDYLAEKKPELALSAAIKSQNPEMVRLLVANGARLDNIDEYGRSAEEVAKYSGSVFAQGPASAEISQIIQQARPSGPTTRQWHDAMTRGREFITRTPVTDMTQAQQLIDTLKTAGIPAEAQHSKTLGLTVRVEGMDAIKRLRKWEEKQSASPAAKTATTLKPPAQ